MDRANARYAALAGVLVAKRAPLKGEHTGDVLRSLAGYTAEEIRQLREKQVI
jgi:hypothetical protein